LECSHARLLAGFVPPEGGLQSSRLVYYHIPSVRVRTVCSLLGTGLCWVSCTCLGLSSRGRGLIAIALPLSTLGQQFSKHLLDNHRSFVGARRIFIFLGLEQPALVNLLQDVKAAVKGVQPAGTLAGRTANSIHWSPQGRNLVLAGLKVGPRRRRLCITS